MNEIKLELEKILLDNFSFYKNNGHAGYDPQIYWELFFSKKAQKTPSYINYFLKKIELGLLNYFPFLLRPYLKILALEGRAIIPYGIAVYIQAFVRMYEYFSDRKFLEEAITSERLLFANLIAGKSGFGIGNPKFSHKSSFNDGKAIYLPGGSEAIFAYCSLYKVTLTEEYLALAGEISKGLIHNFPIKKCAGNSLAFDYSSSGDGTHVLNANALAAGAICLVEAFNSNPNKQCESLINGIYNYLSKYLSEDSLPYAGVEDMLINPSCNNYDCYHTGFTLRGLALVANYLGKSQREISRHTMLMLNNFLDTKGNILVHRLNNRLLYDDIHAVAEYIHAVALNYNYLTEADKKYFLNIAIANIKKFSSGDGTYFYRILKFSKIRLYMPRWGHAPMMNAIVSLLIAIESD